MVIFEALLKSLPCFQCSWNLQGIIIDDLSGDSRQVCKKIYRARVFLNNAKFVGMDQEGRGGGGERGEGNSVVFHLSFLTHSACQYDVA